MALLLEWPVHSSQSHARGDLESSNRSTSKGCMTLDVVKEIRAQTCWALLDLMAFFDSQ
jgi:hypothetical protein